LIEVIIAFAIAAFAMAALFQGAMAGLTSTRAAGNYEEALALGRSRLAMLTRGMPLVPGEQQSDDGRFHWRVRIAPLASTTPRSFGMARPLGPEGRPITLYAIDLTVSWREGNAARSVRLDTREIGQAAPVRP
jgi:hypothetical protein